MELKITETWFWVAVAALAIFAIWNARRNRRRRRGQAVSRWPAYIQNIAAPAPLTPSLIVDESQI